MYQFNKNVYIIPTLNNDQMELYHIFILNKYFRYCMIMVWWNKMNYIKFIKLNVSNELFIDRIFYTNKNNCNPIEALFIGSISNAMLEIIFYLKLRCKWTI